MTFRNRSADRRPRRLALAAIAAGVAVLAPLAVASAQAGVKKPPAGQKATAPAATAMSFAALPPDHVLEIGNKEMTKAQFVAEYEQLKRSAGPIYRAKTSGPLEMQAERLQASKVATDNARVQQLGSAKSRQPAAQGAKVAAQPKLDQVIALEPITPGERFYIFGSGLGAGPGKAEMIFSNPSGRVTLQVVYWNPDGVAMEVALPSNVGNRCDQAVTVQVTRADGAQSNAVPAEFGEALTMKFFDFKFSSEDCSHSAAATASGHDGSSANYCEDKGSGLRGIHYYDNQDLGVDSVRLPPLANGYHYASAMDWTQCTPPVTCLTAISGFAEGSTQALVLFIPWQYWRPNASYRGLEYGLQVTVVGPECKHYLHQMSAN